MDIKKFWKETFAGFVLKNVLIAIAIVVALSWAALISIDYYTHHGESEVIPDLRGMYVEEAEVLLAKKGLYPQIVDSVYVRGKKLGTIIYQTPAANSNIKTNRPVYIIINSRNVHQVGLPEINDVSLRQAVAMLQSIGLNVSNTEYAPSEYKDLVIEVKYNGRTILPGTRVPEGSSLVLVVGNGLGQVDAAIPAVKGMTLDEATEVLQSGSFTLGAVEYDVPPSGNESEYIIYRQRPASGNPSVAGTRIDVYLTTNKARLNEKFEEDKKQEEGEEQFF